MSKDDGDPHGEAGKGRGGASGAGAPVSGSLQRRQVFRLPRAQRVADIMETAREVFREKGYSDTAIAEIAERVGIVEGTIYRYFPSKRDLLTRVVEHWYEAMLSDYDQQLKGIRGTWNRLRFMIWRHLRVIHEDPALCRLIFNELRSGPDYRETAVFDLNRRYTQRTLAIVEEGIAGGELRPGIPLRVVRDMIYGGIEHHAWAFLRGEGDFSPDEAADAITDIIYRGLAAGNVSADDASAGNASGAPFDRTVTRLEQVADRLESLAKGAAGRPRTTEEETSC